MPDREVYLEFRYCKKQCFECHECGYFWGPAADARLRGKPAIFAVNARKARFRASLEWALVAWADTLAKLAT